MNDEKSSNSTPPITKRRGPKPGRVKTDQPWGKAVKKALHKKRPKDGWPDKDSHSEPDSGPEKD